MVVFQFFYWMIVGFIPILGDGIQPQLSIEAKEVSASTKKSFGLKDDLKYCHISFVDNGIGFDQQYADQIFQIFHRLHPKASFSGSGIGLALCRKIAHYHNGIIYAESKIHKGSTFHVILPVTHSKK